MKFNKKLLIILCISSILLISLDIYIILIARKETKNMQSTSTLIKSTEISTEISTETSTEPALDESFNFYAEEITDELASEITGISFHSNPDIQLSDLRHVVVKYIDFNGDTQTGELIVNKAVVQDVIDIFKDLYLNSYQIEKIKLIDKYNGDDEASMEDDNTSCFNYRNIDGQTTLSDHSYGLAIDINPLYNPYIRTNMGDRNILPVTASAYADRSLDFAHKITKNDYCYKAFISRGWQWGGDWDSPKDYQHFYKSIS